MKSKASESLPCLWFERTGQRFAAPMDQLQEVLSAPPLRPLPGSEPALAGLISLRDTILPVFDPASFASGSRPSRSPISGVVLVLGPLGRPHLGLLAERVGKMVELPPPAKLTIRVRTPAAFAGQCEQPGQPRLLVINPAALAAAMELDRPAVE